MPKKYPPLKFKEVSQILKALGFILDHQTGSHQQWYRETANKKYAVTLAKHKKEIPTGTLKNIIHIQSGASREEFYGAIKSTAKKLN